MAKVDPEGTSKTYTQDGEEVVQAELFPKDIIELEKERIRSYDRRTEIAKAAIDASSAADERQYQYHMEKLKTDAEQADKRFSFCKQVVIWGGGASFLFVLFLIATSLFGSEIQAKTAFTLLKVMFTALGGYGVISLIIRVVRSSFR